MKMPVPHALVLFLALLVFAVPNFRSWAAKPPQVVVSTTVAKVKGHTMTSREVEISRRVEVMLYPPKKPVPPAALGSKKFYQEVNRVLLEWVVYLEAQAFDAAQVSNSELEAAQQNVVRAGRSNSDWKALGVKSDELRTLLQRKLQAKKFIQFKAKSSVVPVTDQEAMVYFEKHRLEFGNLPYENFKDNIKAFLARKHVDQRLRDWFEVLQNKYKVRNFIAER